MTIKTSCIIGLGLGIGIEGANADPDTEQAELLTYVREGRCRCDTKK